MKYINLILLATTLSFTACSPVFAVSPAMNMALASSHVRSTPKSSHSVRSNTRQYRDMTNNIVLAALVFNVFRNHSDACAPRVNLSMTNQVAIPCKPGNVSK